MPWAGRIEDFRGQSGYNIAITVLEHSCHRCTYRYMEEDPSYNSLERTGNSRPLSPRPLGSHVRIQGCGRGEEL